MKSVLIATVSIIIIEIYHQYYAVEKDHELREQIKKDFTQQPHFLIALFALAIFSYYTIYLQSNKEVALATRRSIVGIIVAYCAHLDLVVTAFTIVWLASYYCELG